MSSGLVFHWYVVSSDLKHPPMHKLTIDAPSLCSLGNGIEGRSTLHVVPGGLTSNIIVRGLAVFTEADWTGAAYCDTLADDIQNLLKSYSSNQSTNTPNGEI